MNVYTISFREWRNISRAFGEPTDPYGLGDPISIVVKAGDQMEAVALLRAQHLRNIEVQSVALVVEIALEKRK